MVLRAVVISTLLYGCETRVTYRRDLCELRQFQQQKVRSMLTIKWEDRITNDEGLQRPGLTITEVAIAQHQLRWTGHVRSMDPCRLPRRRLYSELQQGTGPRGAPKRGFNYLMKQPVTLCDIGQHQWKILASNRLTWKKKVREGIAKLETARKEDNGVRRARRKQKLQQPQQAPKIPCRKCIRLFIFYLDLHVKRRHKSPHLCSKDHYRRRPLRDLFTSFFLMPSVSRSHSLQIESSSFVAPLVLYWTQI